jgi:hypothetical protein
MGDVDSGGQWLTYKQLANLRGIKQRAAVRLSQRRGWRRQPGNDGETRVLVPADMLEPSQRPSQGDAAGDDRATPPPLIAQAVAALETAVSSLTDQLAKAESRATAATTRAERAEGERDQARADHAKAMQANRKWEATDAARKAKGRLRRAWDGWRGR